LEGHGGIITIRTQITILHAQLPDHRSKPLLTSPQIGSLILCGVEVCWQGIAQLFLKSGKVRRRAIGSSLIPESDETFVKWSEEIDEM
jgi:hypothetical protein